MITSVSTFCFFYFKLTNFTNHCFKKSNFHWSVAKSNLTLWNSMNCSMPGFSVLHYLPGFSQTCVHWVGNAIHPSHPLLPFSPAHNLPQHQGLFHSVCSLHHVVKKEQYIFTNWWKPYCSFRTHSKLLLLSTQQANNWETSRWGRNSNFIQKVSKPKIWWTCTPKTILPELELSPLLY